MKNHALLITFTVFMAMLAAGCSATALETAKFRSLSYETNNLTITENGLTQVEINSITQTKPPTRFPVDLSFVTMKDRYVDNSMEQVFLKNIVDSLKGNSKIGRLVPIPGFIIPKSLNIPRLQELGIRTLTEYIIVLNIDSDTFFKIEELINSRVEINSTVEFVVIDSRTTAIVAADRLFSRIEYESQVFKNTNRQKAFEQLYAEQGKLLSKTIADMFKGI